MYRYPGQFACIEETKTGPVDTCIIDSAGAAEFLKANDKVCFIDEGGIIEKTTSDILFSTPKTDRANQFPAKYYNHPPLYQ